MMDGDDDDGDFFFATCPWHQDFKDDDNVGDSDGEIHENDDEEDADDKMMMATLMMVMLILWPLCTTEGSD